MDDLHGLLRHLEELLAELETLEDGRRARVYELLDGIDTLHRMALPRPAGSLDAPPLGRRRDDPAVAWLLDAYAVGVDEKAAAEAALLDIRPYIHSHGGIVEVLGADRGVVRLRMSGACSGCTASAITLQHGIEQSLREHMPGFVAVEIEHDDAAVHPPPGPTPLEIQPPL